MYPNRTAKELAARHACSMKPLTRAAQRLPYGRYVYIYYLVSYIEVRFALYTCMYLLADQPRHRTRGHALQASRARVLAAAATLSDRVMSIDRRGTSVLPAVVITPDGNPRHGLRSGRRSTNYLLVPNLSLITYSSTT